MSKMITRLALLAGMAGTLVPTLSRAQDADETGKEIRAEVEAQIAEVRAKADQDKAEADQAKVKAIHAKVEAEVQKATAKAHADAARSVFSQVRFYQSTGGTGLELAEVSDAIRSQVELPEGQGVVVVTVRPGSTAAKSGLKPNDLLVHVDATNVANVHQAQEVLEKNADKEVKIKVIRAGKPQTLELLGKRNDDKLPLNRFQITRDGSSSRSLYWIGVPVSPVDATLRSHLSDLPSKAGLIVNDVVKDSPAAKAGLAKNDVLVSIGEKPLTSLDVLVAQVRDSEGKPLHLDYLRAGKKVTVTITPEKHEGGGDEKGEFTARSVFRSEPHTEVNVNSNEVFTFTPQDFKALSSTLSGRQIEINRDGQAKALMLQKLAGETSTKEIEAALKELSAKMEEISKSVEAIRKATAEMKKSSEK